MEQACRENIKRTATMSKGSPLEMAILMDNVDVVRSLLKHGANPNGNALATTGGSMLELSTHNHLNNQIEIMNLLVDHGANVDGRHSSGLTLLQQAVVEEDDDLVGMLLKWGADANLVISAPTSPVFDETPL